MKMIPLRGFICKNKDTQQGSHGATWTFDDIVATHNLLPFICSHILNRLASVTSKAKIL